MASGQTTNFGLNQWHPEDPVLRQEFNQDNARLDATLAEMGARIPKFISGSYTGTGTYGPDGACVLHFGFAPKMVILNTQAMTSSNDVAKYYFLFPGMTWFPVPDSGSANHLTWLEDGISWYYEYQYDEPDEQASRQYNSRNKEYSYIAVTW